MNRLLTVPAEEDRVPEYLPTGNEFVAVPQLRPDGAVESVNVLHSGLAALLELVGAEGEPLLAPVVEVGGRAVPVTWEWERAHGWIPVGSARSGSLQLRQLVLAPVGHRGLLLRLEAVCRGSGPARVTLGWQGCWAGCRQTVYTPRPLRGSRAVWGDPWSGGAVFELRAGAALLGWAVAEDGPQPAPCRWRGPAGWGQEPGERAPDDPEPVRWRLVREVELGPGQQAAVTAVLALAREADGARTTAVDLRRRGFARLLEETVAWLAGRTPVLEGEGAALNPRFQLNLWFNYFYSQGLTVDREERVMVTSRSPLYYVSAAFWARDALLWSFPAILLVDPALARELLLVAFTRYFRHAGIHSLYLDGTLLYPGFELDELAAYAVAAERYVATTGDDGVLDEPPLAAGLPELERRLAPWAHPRVPLYGTFLYPSDDPAHYPYTTYGNALVWRMLRFLARLHDRAGRAAAAARLRRQASEVRDAVYRHLVVDGPFGPMFAYAADLEGRYVLYDEPPGSLQLLAYYGFCAPDDPVYRNTVRWIRSPHNPYAYEGRFPGVGCPHAEHPFVMDLFNGLLAGERERPLQVLRDAPLDGGLACESFDRDTGRVRTGRAFATCAGFLAYAMAVAWGGVPGLDRLQDPRRGRAGPAARRGPDGTTP